MNNNFDIPFSNQWIKNNPIPEGKSTWGTFGKLEQMNQLIIRNVLEKPAKSFKSDAERKAKVYYESCLDVDEHMEKLGAKPMNDLLRQIGGWNVTQSGYNVTKWKLGTTLKLLHNKLAIGSTSNAQNALHLFLL